MPLSPSFLTV